jgi:hypothetical protein
VVVVVVTVSVAVCAEIPEMVAEGVTPQVAGLVAPVGAMVTAQERLTAPVNPLEGVTVIMDVLAVAALASTVILPLFASTKPGGGAAATTTELVPVALL